MFLSFLCLILQRQKLLAKLHINTEWNYLPMKQNSIFKFMETERFELSSGMGYKPASTSVGLLF